MSRDALVVGSPSGAPSHGKNPSPAEAPRGAHVTRPLTPTAGISPR